MNRKKCPSCNSPITKRNGKRNGVQLYKCQACGRQFRAGEKPTNELLWYLYQERKQTA
ncbi:MAG: IS1 family transposase, partial [Paludibacteraceae bacterium]|nr:IS1 family transposase [Paludibacteraceae bacterium]